MNKAPGCFLAVAFAFAMSVDTAAEARSITGVERRFSQGGTFLNVTFESGEPGDAHALYIAYDTEDKGDDISNWAALQRGCNVADDATSATIPVSPLLTGAGYTVARVFLTTSAAPYDTLIESLRQTGTQYIDTGIYPDSTSVAVMDVSLDSKSPQQQRLFGVSSDGTSGDYAKFSFDCYINGSDKFATACRDGTGDWKTTDAFTTDRVRISLSAVEKHRAVITNLTTGAQLADKKNKATCSKTSTATLLVLAQHYVKSTGAEIPSDKIANGACLYGFQMITNSMLACDYKPCKIGGRVGVYDTVTETIVYSASGTDFDTANSGSPVACSLLAGETQLSAAPATDLPFDFTWGGTAVNWGDADAWTMGGDLATWANYNNAIFTNENATATLVADVTANSIAFNADATVATNGTDAATLAVKSVSVATGVSAAISAPTAGALEKTGAGTLTLAVNRTDATTVTEGTLKMDGATVSGLTLGTDGGEPVVFDYGGQTLKKNPQAYLVTGSSVTLTNGVFATAANSDLNLRDDLDTQVFPTVLTIAKDASLRKTTTSKNVYICKDGSGSSTINVSGGSFEITGGSEASYIQHKSVSGRVNINVTDGGLMCFPGVVYALCRGDINVTSPSLYMTFSGSTFNTGGNFYFENDFKTENYFNVPVSPTGVFAATNSVVSVGGSSFLVGRNKQDEKSSGSLTVDFEGCTVTAKTFAVYYDRPLNNARFNDTRFVFGAASGSIVASDGESNWITVGTDGLTLDTQEYSATLNANLGGSGAVAKVGSGTLTVARDQASTGGFTVSEGTLTVNGSKTFAGTVAFAAGTALNIVGYNGTTPVRASALALPAEGTVALTMNGGAFAKGVYAICAASGVTAADGAKFAPSTGEETAAWSVEYGTLLLNVGGVSGNYWTGRGGDGRMSTAANWLNGVPAAGADIDLSFISSATTIIADADRTFGAVTMGTGVVTFTNAMAATSFTDTSKVAVAADSSVTIDGDLMFSGDGDKYAVYTVGTGGRFVVTGRLGCEPDSSAKLFPQESVGGGIVIAGETVNDSSSNIHACVNKTSQKWAIGPGGMTGSCGWWCLNDNANSAYIYPLTNDFTVAVPTCLREKFGHYELNTTGFEDDLPHTITLDAGYAENGKLFIAGTGMVVVNHEPAAYGSSAAYSGAVTVQDTATLAINAGKALTTGKITVNGGATLQVAESAASAGTAAVTLGGNLTLQDNASLGFNFTERATAPVLALASGKTLSFTGDGATNITVKVSGKWPKGGDKVLTTCGGFGAEGVNVTLAEGAPRWAKRLYVNADGNIALEVKPMAVMIVVR